ncbi:hypothetical protein LSM04_005137 [Trypanosoma melophagium]|nr:hypothetical protein LSM04_005137 [Trypanosoma melophagium]
MGKEQLALPNLQQSTSSSSSDGDVSSFSGSTDKWLERLNSQLHASEEVTGNNNDNNTSKGTIIDGNALREKLLASGCIGSKSRPLGTSSVGGTSDINSGEKNTEQSEKMSPAERRMAALKARYAFAKRLKEETRPQVSSGGVHIIQGYSPRKQTRL